MCSPTALVKRAVCATASIPLRYVSSLSTSSKAKDTAAIANFSRHQEKEWRNNNGERSCYSSAEVRGIFQHRVDDQGFGPIVVSKCKSKPLTGSARVSACDEFSTALDLLICDRLVPSQ